jgi:photosystem II stability/assembly factor-like uncharacterized protein
MATVAQEVSRAKTVGTTRLLIAMQDALVIADGQDERFDAHEALTGRVLQCLASDPHQASRIYCGTFGDGLWASDDGGASWRPLRALTARQVTAVAVSATERHNGFGVVYVGTEPSAVFWSGDGGSTWHECPALTTLPSSATWSFPPRPQTHHVRWIGLDARLPGRLFVAIEAGALVRSVDGGRTWLDRAPNGPYDTHTLVTHTLAPGHLYSAAGDGYFESDDAGANWRQPQRGLEHRYLWSLAVDPHDPGVVIASAARSPHAAHDPRAADSAIYRRANGGEWEILRDGLPAAKGTTVGVITASAAESGVFYLVNNRGVYRSNDSGVSWHALAIPWPPRFHLQRAVAVVAGSL